jgi:hypothetical protein
MKRFDLYLTEAQIEYLLAMSKRDDMSMAGAIRLILNDHISRKKEEKHMKELYGSPR